MNRFGSCVALVLLTSCATPEGATTRKVQGLSTVEEGATLTLPVPFVTRTWNRVDACGSQPSCDSVDSDQECCTVASTEPRKVPHLLPEQDLFTPRDGAEYRIPALVQTKAGPLIAFAEKRYDSRCSQDSGKIEVVYRVRMSPTQGWGAERVLCRNPLPTTVAGTHEDWDVAYPTGDTCGNPTPVYDSENDRVAIVMSANNGNYAQHQSSVDSCGMVLITNDTPGARKTFWSVSNPVSAWPSGISFSTPKDITALVRTAPMGWDMIGPGNGLDLGNGRLVFPASKRNILAQATVTNGQYTASWSAMSVPGTSSEGAIVERLDGSLMRNDRFTGSEVDAPGELFRRKMSIQGSDGTWSAWTRIDQPLSPSHDCAACGLYGDSCNPRPASCPGSGFGVQGSIGRYSGKGTSRLFFTNPGNSLDRIGLAVRLSYDEGVTWPLGRELVAPTNTNPTGYSSAALVEEEVGSGVGILFERAPLAGGAKTDAIHYLWASLSALLCGRSEPIHVAGNSWLGSFAKMDRDSLGITRYEGSATTNTGTQGTLVIESTLTTLTTAPQQVQAWFDGIGYTATVSPSNPGRYTLDGVTIVTVDPWVSGSAWCEKGY
jgi:hypothetical protein